MNLWSITRKSPDYEQPSTFVVVADDENNARIFAARHAWAGDGASWAVELVLPELSDVELIGQALESHDAGTVVVTA